MRKNSIKIFLGTLFFMCVVLVNNMNVQAERNFQNIQGMECALDSDESTCEVYGVADSNLSVYSIPEKVIYEGKSYTVNKVLLSEEDGNANLSQINIPSTVDSLIIGLKPNTCPKLKKIIVDKSNNVYCSDENGWVYSKDKTVLYFVPFTLTNVVIPMGVKIVECDFMDWEQLISIEMADSVEAFGSKVDWGDDRYTYTTDPAFSGCKNLKSVKLSSSLTELRDFMFYECTSLKTITIPSKITKADYSFVNSGIQQVIFANGATRISRRMFDRCSALREVQIPNTVTEIGECAFFQCPSLKTITIPKSVTKIDDIAFSYPMTIYGYYGTEAEAYVKRMNSDENIKYKFKFVALDGPKAKGTTLNVSAQQCQVKVTSSFAKAPAVSYIKSTNSKAKAITIPDTVKVDGITYKVTSVAANALANNKKVTKITVGKNVTSIGKNAFKKCIKLKTVTLKSTSLKSIGSNAFYGDKNLKTITIKSSKLTSKSVGKNALKGTNKKLIIKVPKKKVSSYKKFLKKKGNKNITVKKG